MGEFMDLLFYHNASFRDLSLTEHDNDGRRGVALTIPPPDGSDLAGPLIIEEVGLEVTIRFDYGEFRIGWPERRYVSGRWLNSADVLREILEEKILSCSGWVDGTAQMATLCDVNESLGDFDFPKYRYLRFRSWKGAFDRDVACSGTGI